MSLRAKRGNLVEKLYYYGNEDILFMRLLLFSRNDNFIPNNILKLIPEPNEWERRILKQIARELLLMEGSDWPFLLYTEQAKEYANQRFHHHHQRFNKLMWAAKDFNDKKRLSMQNLEEIELIDSCFQDINIDYFKKIE